MGRRKKEAKSVQKHLRIPEKINQFIESQAIIQEIPYNDFVIELLGKGAKKHVSKYEGFRWIKHMSNSYTCFECQKRYMRGNPAWLDDETGGTLCPRCGVYKYSLGSDVNVKQDMKFYKKGKLLKDYNAEIEKRRKTIDQLDKDIENRELVSKLRSELHELKETAYRVLGMSNTPKDFKLTAEGLLRLIDKNEKILELTLSKKEKETWERLKEKQKRKKREKNIYSET